LKTNILLERQNDNNLRGANIYDSFSALTVDTNARPPWLQNPHFVGMIETDEKVFVFFREVAVEASYEDDTVKREKDFITVL